MFVILELVVGSIWQAHGLGGIAVKTNSSACKFEVDWKVRHRLVVHDQKRSALKKIFSKIS